MESNAQSGGIQSAASQSQGPEATDITRSLSFGEKAVGISFNPGKNLAVESIKTKFAVIIDELNEARDYNANPEIKRMYSVAITEAQSAQMWAVKAATWQY